MLLPPHIRVRCADQHPLIFERPGSQPKAARGAMVLMTGVGWTIWLYLWRPVLTMVLWLSGAEIAQYQWIGLAGWSGLLDFAAHTMPYGLALCATLLIWASVNYIRFRGSDRRKARPPATVEADAEWTRMPPAALAESRRLKNLVCCHDDEGHLVSVISDGFQVAGDHQKTRQKQKDQAYELHE